MFALCSPGASLGQPVIYVTILNLEKKRIKSLSYRKKANYLKYSYGLHIDYFSYIFFGGAKLQLPVVLCALLLLDYLLNMKIVTNII